VKSTKTKLGGGVKIPGKKNLQQIEAKEWQCLGNEQREMSKKEQTWEKLFETAEGLFDLKKAGKGTRWEKSREKQ